MTALSLAQTRRVRTLFIVAALIAALFGNVAPRPAAADGAASTRNIILGAAAAVAGIIIYNNVQHKHAAARNDVVGYTRDGGVVHRDGRITYPNGHTLYTSNGDGRPCGYDAYHERCGAQPVAYYRNTDRGDVRQHDNGYHRGWYKHGDNAHAGAWKHHDHGDHDHGDHGEHE